MAQEANNPKRVAVIGGGITGLAAAHRLRELDETCEVVLYEASSKLGGVLQTTCRDDYLIEHAADNFITNVPWAVDLCRRIGFEDELIRTDDRYRKAFVVHNGRLVPVPDGFALMAPARVWPVLTTPILSVGGKLRLMREYFLPPRRDIDDECLESFATRRLGKEVYERIVQPLVGGIYTADPTKLSLAATLPRFLEMEREHGGLIRGALRQTGNKKQDDKESSGARYSLFVAPRAGMASLVEALHDRLIGSIEVDTPVRTITQQEGQWRVEFATDRPAEKFTDVILATSAPVSAKLIADCHTELSIELSEIPYAGASVVCLGYSKSSIEHPLDGFGFVVPSVAERKILAGSFSSVKYPGRAPEGHVLIRVFVGGALQPELAALPDDELIQLVRDELAELIGAKGEPDLCHITRWEGAMPQYHLGHLERVQRIEDLVSKLPGLAIAGNAYHGVGIPQCIHHAEQAAERIASSE